MEKHELIEKCRSRLTEYRFSRIDSEVSIHVNALEISLCLIEYAIEKKRAIKKEELIWFDAGLQLEYVFGGSEWEDLLDYYDFLIKFAKDNKLIGA